MHPWMLCRAMPIYMLCITECCVCHHHAMPVHVLAYTGALHANMYASIYRLEAVSEWESSCCTCRWAHAFSRTLFHSLSLSRTLFLSHELSLSRTLSLSGRCTCRWAEALCRASWSKRVEQFHVEKFQAEQFQVIEQFSSQQFQVKCVEQFHVIFNDLNRSFGGSCNL